MSVKKFNSTSLLNGYIKMPKCIKNSFSDMCLTACFKYSGYYVRFYGWDGGWDVEDGLCYFIHAHIIVLRWNIFEICLFICHSTMLATSSQWMCPLIIYLNKKKKGKNIMSYWNSFMTFIPCFYMASCVSVYCLHVVHLLWYNHIALKLW